ncbi:DUF2505 domain-containing protein [Corynebacterium sp.]|uniref:DUF2505 domain-containing protein n=1 Tax=Corynebacterium sp. TaxID=1720 RepID=UPI0026DD6073|nr:DUF2505 domain-containing protein [Corynebacterium sp.]MDO4609892.1 DUF2505 domain-containing protein [Corynebacterium sp.]
MATRTDVTATVPHAPEKVHEALSSNEYWTWLAQNMSSPAGEVTSFSSGEHTEVSIDQQLPTDELPDAVKGFVQNGLTVARKVSWGPLDADGATATVSAEVSGFPVSFTGSQKLAPEGDGSAISASVDVTVSIPMMGAMLEPKVAGAVQGLFEREAEMLARYISERS